jgi:hypothetical protein
VNYPAASSAALELQEKNFPKGRHPRMLLSGGHFGFRLDSRLKHAGMTIFGIKFA